MGCEVQCCCFWCAVGNLCVAGEKIARAADKRPKTPEPICASRFWVKDWHHTEVFTQRLHASLAVEAVASATAHLAAVTWLQNPACGWAQALQTVAGCTAFYTHHRHRLHDQMHMLMGVVIGTFCCCCRCC
jgi:hypothetical protein